MVLHQWVGDGPRSNTPSRPLTSPRDHPKNIQTFKRRSARSVSAMIGTARSIPRTPLPLDPVIFMEKGLAYESEIGVVVRRLQSGTRQ
jgi:hypothetical protein